jgi:hypothetical protein
MLFLTERIPMIYRIFKALIAVTLFNSCLLAHQVVHIKLNAHGAAIMQETNAAPREVTDLIDAYGGSVVTTQTCLDANTLCIQLPDTANFAQFKVTCEGLTRSIFDIDDTMWTQKTGLVDAVTLKESGPLAQSLAVVHAARTPTGYIALAATVGLVAYIGFKWYQQSKTTNNQQQ